MVNETILAVIIAFVISAILCPIVIPFLHKLKFGQQVRDDGPQAHLKKQGTPTMGGLVILSSIIITSLLYLKDYPKIIPVLFVTAGFGVIGFLDDYIKIVMKRSEGLNPGQKLAGQIIITGIFAYYIITSDEIGTQMLIPFTGQYLVMPVWLFVPGKSLLRESLRIILLRLMRSERRCLFRSRGNTWLCRSGFLFRHFSLSFWEQTTV